MMASSDTSKRFLIFCGISVALLGMTVIVGWHLRMPALISLSPDFVAMQYNTALAFLASGLALPALVRERNGLAALAALTVLLLGSLTLIQYLLHLDLGLDRLFLDSSFYTLHTSHPGRMAPNTALCFILAGLALLLRSLPIPHRDLPVWILGLLVLILGATALAGYLLDMGSAYGWFQLTRMAPQTGFAFFLLGAALLAVSRHDFSRQLRNPYLTQWVALLHALLGLGGLLTFMLLHQHDLVIKQEGERLITQVRVIDTNLLHQMKSIHRVMGIVRDSLSAWRTQPKWAEEVSLRFSVLCETMPGVRTLHLQDDEGIIRAANRSEIIGANLSERAYFRTTRQGNDPAMFYLSQPFTTRLGAWGMQLSMPLTEPDGRFSGAVHATLDPDYFRTLLHSVIYAPDMWSSVVHGDGILYLIEPPRPELVGKTLYLPGTFFTRHLESGQVETLQSGYSPSVKEERMVAFRTVRSPELPLDKPLVVVTSRRLSDIVTIWRHDALLLTSLFAVIVVLSVLGLLKHQRRQKLHERLMEERNLALREGEERFRSLFSSMLNGFALHEIIVDDAGRPVDYRYLEINSAFTAMTGLSAQQVLGKRVLELLPNTEPFWIETYGKVALTGEAARVQNYTREIGKYFDVYAFSPRHGQFAVVFEEITERILAQNALQESEERFRLISENMLDLICVHAPDATYTY
ncbi:MAG: PAS domain S-box protein, partial [Magnetococcales bacterium]|nr:PAS domain S-box protein [Magnetococcales bacterium]